ncbi:MAG: hypothetical protein Q7T26_06330 [Dehalococcoidia bacterium]|nr:hypothetical protein [Dehalococcoidia bacterium]
MANHFALFRDPTAPTHKAQRKTNPLPTNLKGKTVAFLNNDGSGLGVRIQDFYNQMERVLKERYGVTQVFHREKFRTMTGQGAPDELVKELASRADLVINGMGV